MSQSPGTPLTEEVRFRVPLPIVIPLVALVIIGALTIGMSRILLSVPKEVATIIAIAVAVNVLIGAAVVAARPTSARSSWAELAIVFAYPIIVGVVLAQMDIGGDTHAVAEESGAHGEEATGSEGAESAAGIESIEAASFAFSTEELALPADEEVELEFVNEDAAPHNVAIYESEGGKPLFQGETISAGQQTTYAIPALEAGEYHFQCDVHPSMAGTVTVE